MLAIFDFAVNLVEWSMREVKRKAITAIRHAEENRGESAAVSLIAPERNHHNLSFFAAMFTNESSLCSK